MLPGITRPRTVIATALVALFDGLLGGLSMYAVMRLRFIYADKMAPNDIDIKAGVVFGVVCVCVWLALRMHRAVWRYTSLDDILPLARGVVIAAIITPLILFLGFDRAADLPRSAPFLVIPFFLSLLLLSRAAVLLFYQRDLKVLFRRRKNSAKRAVLIGRSNSLHDHLRDFAHNATGGSYNVTGLIDTDGGFLGRSIRGVPVMGAIDDIPVVLRNLERRGEVSPTLILVDKTVDREQLNALVKQAAEAQASLVRFGKAGNAGLMPFEANDLIGRNAKDLDVTPVRQFIEGRKVLITGAGGTIGSELTRQVSRLRPDKIILIDNGEYNLYKIDAELTEHKLCKWHAYLGDVQDETRMSEIFEYEQPDIVLHAAALKHVPLSELNPIETINSNVGGTYNIIKQATRFNTDSFTLISTDKAVKPSNIMGATKRIAEMATLAAATQSPGLSACAVRFGNVLGSTGSVVPLFEEQISRGGPVTVTHKDATRYFMTTEEAAALVLQASALSAMQRKEMAAIYVLDMGDPVNITRLARQLIRLRGYVPDRDIDIVFTGLRPGEKLTEALTGLREELAGTYVDGVSRFTGRIVDPKSVIRRIEALLRAAEQRDKPAMITALSKLLPDYRPNGTLHERI